MPTITKRGIGNRFGSFNTNTGKKSITGTKPRKIKTLLPNTYDPGAHSSASGAEAAQPEAQLNKSSAPIQKINNAGKSKNPIKFIIKDPPTISNRGNPDVFRPTPKRSRNSRKCTGSYCVISGGKRKRRKTRRKRRKRKTKRRARSRSRM